MDGKPRPLPTLQRGYDTVEELQATAASVQARYAPNTGVPISVSVDAIANAIDDEWSFTVSRIRAPRGG